MYHVFQLQIITKLSQPSHFVLRENFDVLNIFGTENVNSLILTKGKQKWTQCAGLGLTTKDHLLSYCAGMLSHVLLVCLDL